MADVVEMRWTTAPSEDLIPGIEEWGRKVTAAVVAVGQLVATELEGDAKRGAPWTDRTGNARSGLFGEAEQAGADLVRIYLSHGASISYGVYLELSNGGQYQIIAPTIQRALPRVNSLLQEIFR